MLFASCFTKTSTLSKQQKQTRTSSTEEINLIDSIKIHQSFNESPMLFDDDSCDKTCQIQSRSLKANSVKIRQNFPEAKVLSKSKMKTLKLTLTVVIAYVLCTLPFYIATLTHFFFGSQIKKYSIECE